MRKVIFLDVDGVLNSLASRRGRDDLPPGFGGLVDPALHKRARVLDPVALELLTELVRETGAELVLSSMWRMITGVDGLEELLAALGYPLRFVGHTPIPVLVPGSLFVAGRPRGSEIAEWLADNHDVEAIVILDDEPPEEFGRLANWLVLTDFATGLERVHVEAAKIHLRQPSPLTIHSRAALQLRSDRGPLEQGEHVWFTVRAMTSCAVCGVCRRGHGLNKPCRGPVRIGLREAPMELAEEGESR